MEKWTLETEIESPLNTMDFSQISELANAVIMDSWSSASGNPQQTLAIQSPMLASSLIKQEIIGNNNNSSGTQSSGDQTNKVFIKQELPSELSYGHEYSGINPLQGYFQGHVSAASSEQVPMDDFDPLESFSFWDGENFYCHQDYDACAVATDMQLDNNQALDNSHAMPTLPEYIGDDDMTRDDTFPIKDSDFLHNTPTLAELNSCGETIFDYSVSSTASSNFLTTEDGSFSPLMADHLSKSFQESHFVASPVGSIPNSSFASGLTYVPSGYIDIKQSPLSSSCPPPSRLLPQQFLSAFEDKFPMCPQNSPASGEFFRVGHPMDTKQQQQHLPSPLLTSSPALMVAQSNRLQDSNLLSSSAPPDVTMASYFTKKIKTEPTSSSPGPRSVTERSLSGFSNLSLSNDDESGSFFDDEDEEDDFSSDEDIYQYESDDLLSTSWASGKEEKSSQQHRKNRYFWQYNLQSRGAKTQNILPRRESSDPYVLDDAFDPVFSEECSLPVKHSGKARRGDGNDLTPDPRKLFNIGLELKKLNKLIYNINPTDSGGSHGKPLSRKEKNKLASRVCRLKKKAQHEANKIKLYGLQQEHKKLLSILIETREVIKYKIQNLHDQKVSNCSQKIQAFLVANEPHKVAGNTAAFVNEVLEMVAKGDVDGGLGRL